MAFELSFTDNQEITADLLNQVKQEIGSDVTASTNFVNGKTYHTDDLNCIRKDIVSAGVLRGMGCNVMGGKLKISNGLAVFDNGMRLEVDAEGVELELTPDTVNYVYLYRSTLAQIALPVVTTEPKENVMGQSGLEQEYLPLCEVAGDSVKDTHKWATAKIQLDTGNVSFSGSYHPPQKEIPPGYTTGGLYYTIPLPNAGFNLGYIEIQVASNKVLKGYFNLDNPSLSNLIFNELGTTSYGFRFKKVGKNLEVWAYHDSMKPYLMDSKPMTVFLQ